MRQDREDMHYNLAAEFVYNSMVKFFGGNHELTRDWFRTPNPFLGHASPLTLLNGEKHDLVVDMVQKIIGSKEIQK